MFSRTYAGLAVKGATSRPTLKEDVSYVTDQHYDDVDEQLMTRRRLRALVVRADAGAGRTTITEFMQIVDLPAHTWYDLLRAPASPGALRELMVRRGNVATDARCRRSCDWAASMRRAKSFSEPHDVRAFVAGHSRFLSLAALEFGYLLYLALALEDRTAGAGDVFLPVAASAALALASDACDASLHPHRGAFGHVPRRLYVATTVHVGAVVAPVAYRLFVDENHAAVAATCGAFAAASLVLVFGYSAETCCERGLPVAKMLRDDARTRAAAWALTALFLGLHGVGSFFALARPYARAVAAAAAAPPSLVVAPLAAASAAVACAFVASYYLAFTVALACFGAIRGAAVLGLNKRVSRYVRSCCTTEESKMFSFPWIANDVGGGLVTAHTSELGRWNAPPSEPDRGPPTLFSRGWHAIVEDLARDALLSPAEREALQCVPRTARRLPAECWPANKEARRRLDFMLLTSNMSLPASPGVLDSPSLTVLVPHYGETIYARLEDLVGTDGDDGSPTLLSFLVEFFPDEFARFAAASRLYDDRASPAQRNSETKLGEATRAAVASRGAVTRARGLTLSDDDSWRLRRWASRRTQTLYRTISGLHKYSDALKLLCTAENPSMTSAEVDAVVDSKFSLVVAMQRLPSFTAEERECLDELFYEFPNLRVAYVEEAAEQDGRAFYSCLVDARCEADGAGTRAPRYRVRLPGHPILGHGKGDNQNHALIFTSGEVLQCIDANQDSYLETALMVNCVLAEFNEAHVERAGGARRCAILGFREHIFSSSLGSCGDLAASQEAVFGTLVQRVLSNPLSARQHYGHPDFVDKLRMMQQGGVSKAVRGLHLSEDIFSGFATQLGGGSIVHREYCQVGKGRDLDFNSIMSRGRDEFREIWGGNTANNRHRRAS